MFCIAHLSDLHATQPEPERAVDLLGKRALGWISWRTRRRHLHRPEVLKALIDDLHEVAPDQVVVTGDLTNLALPGEFVAARAWLERIGPPARVFLIPGNHDAYVRIARERSWDLWSEWLAPDGAAGAGGTPEFPTLRVRGPLALVGVCSAKPTPPFFASGSLGSAQRERLEKLLAELAASDLCRVLLIHHPPTAHATSRRRALTDAAALRAILRRTGAELVLHGHMHRSLRGAVPGPGGPIPVIGVRSSSHGPQIAEKRAQYHVYAVAPGDAGSGARFRLTQRTRGYDPSSGRFRAEGESAL